MASKKKSGSTTLTAAGRKEASKKPKKKKGADSHSRPIAENRKARHQYEILQQVECGVVLVGSEVKSLREGSISLNEAYVRVEKGELWLIGADIAEYRQASFWNHKPRRQRKLLVRRKELDKLHTKQQAQGMTLMPLRIFFNGRGLVKVIVGVGRGKKIHDKRDSDRKADARRQIDRQMKSSNRG